MAYVYRHIRIDKNVPFYIGVGCSANYARAKEKSRRSDLWKRIISKSDYCIEIIMDDLSWEDACEKEKEFISLYGRIDLGTGTLVNMTDGGDGTIGIVFTEERKNKISKILKGRKKTKEHKDKMSKAWLNREPISAETKKKMSDSHKGEKSLWYGKKLSNEHREKMSNSKIGKKLSDATKDKLKEVMKIKNNTRKKVVNVATGKIYLSIKDALEQTDLTYHVFCNMLSGRTVNKTNFKYYE